MPFVNAIARRAKDTTTEFHHGGRTRLSCSQSRTRTKLRSAGRNSNTDWEPCQRPTKRPRRIEVGATARLFSCWGVAPRHMTCDALCLRGNSRSHVGELLNDESSATTLSPDEKCVSGRWQLHYRLLTIALRSVTLAKVVIAIQPPSSLSFRAPGRGARNLVVTSRFCVVPNARKARPLGMTQACPGRSPGWVLRYCLQLNSTCEAAIRH